MPCLLPCNDLIIAAFEGKRKGNMEKRSLRFGSIVEIYYELKGEKLPKQMELLDIWFPGLVITIDESDGKTKTPAEYVDREYKIHAVRYQGRLYAGASKRVSQILGRLTGTASGNQEKERRSAELIQRNVAEQFVTDMDLTPRLQENTAALLEKLTEEKKEMLGQQIFDLLYALADLRSTTDRYILDTELFALDDEVFDSILYNAAYQLNLGSFSGLCNAWLWLLTGGLLRNETGRVLRLYESSFIAIRRQISETGELKDKLNTLFYPETYHSFYRGDDLDHRFPGVEWYCDRCDAHLNEQDGFDDHLPEWTCTACGYVNNLDINEIYANDEDWDNRRSVDPEDFNAAIEQRRKEIEQQ